MQSAAEIKHNKDCATCGGTGWLWLNRSWLTADGYRREHCGICSGTGKSNYRDADTKFVKRQADLRTQMARA